MIDNGPGCGYNNKSPISDTRERKGRERAVDDSKEMLELINQQIKDLVGLYRGAVSRLGISENEFWVWYALIVTGGAHTQQDICLMWSLSKQTVNTIISHLARRGLVRLDAIPGTRNRKEIRLTEAGRRFGAGMVLPLFDAERRAIEKLPLQERAACTEAFGKYIASLREELGGCAERAGRAVEAAT